MSQWKSKIIGATLGAVVAMGIGGASLAFAQTADDSTTPTTEAPAVTTPDTSATPPVRGDDCPDKAGTPGSSADSSTATRSTDGAGEV